MVSAHLDTGHLVELPPGLRIDVKLYWTVARGHARTLDQLAQAVRAVAATDLQ
jgi:LysR family transcriptional regulator (chromosome initiation inhibitor)